MPALSIIVSITREHPVTVRTQINKPMTILCLGDKNHIKAIFPQLSSTIIRVFLGGGKKKVDTSREQLMLCLRILLAVEKVGGGNRIFQPGQVRAFLLPSARPTAVLLHLWSVWAVGLFKNLEQLREWKMPPRKQCCGTSLCETSSRF